MVYKAVCGEEGFLNVRTHRRFNKPCKDFPVRLTAVLPKDNVQWGEKCDERGVKFTGSWLMVQG